MSLINSTGFSTLDRFVSDSVFCGLFLRCSGLKDVNNLILPATTLTTSCYSSMFNGCTGLSTAPELPATTLANNCYKRMFYGCLNLNYIKCLATDILESWAHCTFQWVDGVQTTSGTFIKSPNITESAWGRGTSGIPTNWTVVDA